MEIEARRKDSIIILDLSGRLDINSALLVEAVGQCLREGCRDILCNFEDVESVDYMGLSAVVLAYKEVTNSAGRMKLELIPAHLRELFAVTGIDRALEIYGSEEHALSSFKEDRAIEAIKKMQLRRRFRRLPIEIKVELKDSQHRQLPAVKLDIINLSAIGAYIYGCGEFKLGDEVFLKLKLPPQMQELQLQGKVVWLADKQVQRHLYPGMAVEFRGITSAVQNKLIAFIEKNLSLLPTDE